MPNRDLSGEVAVPTRPIDPVARPVQSLLRPGLVAGMIGALLGLVPGGAIGFLYSQRTFGTAVTPIVLFIGLGFALVIMAPPFCAVALGRAVAEPFMLRSLTRGAAAGLTGGAAFSLLGASVVAGVAELSGLVLRLGPIFSGALMYGVIVGGIVGGAVATLRRTRRAY